MEVKIVELDSNPALVIKDVCTPETLNAKFDEIYSEIAEYLKANKFKPAGVPFGIYHSFSPERIDLEAGFPVGQDAKGEGRIELVYTYCGKAAMTEFVGPYEQLKDAWGEFAKAVDGENHQLNGPCFEVYITNPVEEPDTSKWITHLYTPIKN